MTTPATPTGGNVLLALVVISIIVELTLAPIFNWRVYLKRFDGSSYLHPLTWVVTLALFWFYGINPIQALLDAYAQGIDTGIGGSALSALLVMFGSQGVYRIFDVFRIQSRDRRNERMEEARRDE